MTIRLNTERIRRWILAGLLAAALAGCTLAEGPAPGAQPSTPGASGGASLATVTSASPLFGTPAPGRTTEPLQATGGAVTDRSERFQIGQRSTSDDDVLSSVALELRSARLTDAALILRVAFVNIGDERFSIIGSIGGNAATLVDNSGRQYAPEAVDDQLTRIDPADGFAPGTANVGDITFPRPSGAEPYEFRFPHYTPISFRLDTPLADDVAFGPAPGQYALDATIRSQRDALRKIELRVKAVEVREDSLIFDVGFANTDRQGYNLLVGPSGADARLIDGEGQSRAPVEVSSSLERSIAPEGGWAPDQENSGALTFDLPQAAQELRLVFPEYDALTLRFDERGLAETAVTSPSGGAPQPTVAPSDEELAFEAIEQTLTRQAAALESGDAAAYAETFMPELRDEQRQIGAQASSMPLVSVALRLSPDARLNGAAAGAVERVPVELTYALDGDSADNTFLHVLRYSLARDGGTWRVSEVETGDNPPFWLLGDVVARETEHFLIFGRPAALDELPAFEREVEQAYADLSARGLPLESRYVTYFTATQEEFQGLTGRTSRYLGVALSRYEFGSERVRTTSRAFYINGAAFSTGEGRFDADERQTTVTHELAHLALAADTRPYTPPWLAEGVAVYFSEDTGPAARQRLAAGGQLESLSLEQLTRAGSLGEHDVTGERVTYEYLFSGATVAFLVERFGEDQVLAFYRSYAEAPAAEVQDTLPSIGGAPVANAAFANLSARLTAEALESFFGLSLQQLDTDVKAWVREGG